MDKHYNVLHPMQPEEGRQASGGDGYAPPQETGEAERLLHDYAPGWDERHA